MAEARARAAVARAGAAPRAGAVAEVVRRARARARAQTLEMEGEAAAARRQQMRGRAARLPTARDWTSRMTAAAAFPTSRSTSIRIRRAPPTSPLTARGQAMTRRILRPTTLSIMDRTIRTSTARAPMAPLAATAVPSAVACASIPRRTSTTAAAAGPSAPRASSAAALASVPAGRPTATGAASILAPTRPIAASAAPFVLRQSLHRHLSVSSGQDGVRRRLCGPHDGLR